MRSYGVPLEAVILSIGLLALGILGGAEIAYASYADLAQIFSQEERQNIEEALDKSLSLLLGSDLKKDQITVTPLSSGMTSARILKITWHDTSYVLRFLNKKHSFEVRRQEILAHQYAASMKVAPPLLLVDDAMTWMLMPFIEGNMIRSDDLKKPKILQNLAHSIAKVHQYEGDFHRSKTQEDRVKKHYHRILEKKIAMPTVYDTLYENYQSSKERALFLEEKKVLCHADLNRNNILVSDEGDFI